MTAIERGQQHTPQAHSGFGRVVLVAVVVLAVIAAGSLLVSEAPLFMVAAVLMLPVIMAVLTWPDAATLVTIFILYSNLAVVAVRFHNVPFLLGAAFPLLLGIPLTVHLVVRRRELIFTPAFPFLLLFLFVQFLGALFSRDVEQAFSELTFFIIEGLVIYFLITNVVRTPRLLSRVVWILLLAGFLLAVIPIYQQVTGDFDNIYGGLAQTSERGFRTGAETLFGDVRQPRLAGAIGEQNRFAQVLLMLVPLGLFHFWGTGERSLPLRLLALLATAVITTSVVLTFSRGAAVGFLVMVLAMTFMRIIKPYQLLAILLGAALLLALLPQYGTRLASLQSLSSFLSQEENVDDGILESRSTEMLAALMVFADHPVIGVGPGMFKFYSEEYGNRINPGVLEGTREAHSLFPDVAANHGILGLVAFTGIFVATLFELLRMRQRVAHSKPEMVSMLNGFALAIVTYLATGLFLHLSYARFLWLMLALAGAAGMIARNVEEKHSDVIAIQSEGGAQ